MPDIILHGVFFLYVDVETPGSKARVDTGDIMPQETSHNMCNLLTRNMFSVNNNHAK